LRFKQGARQGSAGKGAEVGGDADIGRRESTLSALVRMGCLRSFSLSELERPKGAFCLSPAQAAAAGIRASVAVFPT